VNRSVAEMSIRSARRISGLNRDPIIVILFYARLERWGPSPTTFCGSHYYDYVASHPADHGSLDAP